LNGFQIKNRMNRKDGGMDMDRNDYQDPFSFQAVRDIFPARLKTLREAIGISQEALAKALGVSRATIGYYENGSRLPDIAFLNVLAQKTGCNIHFLLGHCDNMNEEYESLGGETELNDEQLDHLMHLSGYKSFRFFLSNLKTWELFHLMDSMVNEVWDNAKVREVLYYSLCNDFRSIAEDIYAEHKTVKALGKEDYTENEAMALMEKGREKYEQSRREFVKVQADFLEKGKKETEEYKDGMGEREKDPVEAFRMKMGRMYREGRGGKG
jgi:transcriptional regulator with XRE-family HTH domain